MTMTTTIATTEPEVREKSDTLPTIWRVPDELWDKIKRILDQYDPPKRMGRKRIDQRKALDGVIFRMRTGHEFLGIEETDGEYHVFIRKR